MKINIVTDLHPSLLERERGSATTHQWEYSREPTSADLYVVYGITRELQFPLKANPKVFIGIEPPEIAQYDLNVLSQYTLILAADFPYLRSLPNHRVASGLLNWSIGNSDHVRQLGSSRPIPSVDEILSRKTGTDVTMIVSSKKMTQLQKVRIEFSRYLNSRLPNFKVYGRGTNPIDDKLSVLVPNHFHIAFENSQHPGYWTEKLADPIITLTRVFYVGDPSITREFSEHSVTELPYWDFESSLRIIKAGIEQSITDDTIEARINARQYIMTKMNIHSVIEENLGEVFKLNSHGSFLKTIPAHQIAFSTRLRWVCDSLRQRTFSHLS